MSPWEICRRKLQSQLSANEFDSWIKPLQARQFGDRLMLFASNRYMHDEVQHRYLERIEEALAGGRDGSQPIEAVKVIVGEPFASPPKGPKASRSNGAAKKPWQEGRLRPAFTFENFVAGECNRVPLAVAQQLAENPLGGSNPLVIYGDVGNGKTHLRDAIGHRIQERASGQLRVVICHAQHFVRYMVEAFKQRGNAVEAILRHYQAADVLLIDDIQFLRRAPNTQEEFFKIFNILYDRGSQIVLTSDRHPSRIPDLDDGLKSRLAGGLNVAIKPPDRSMSIAVLMRKAQQESISLSSEVLGRIAHKAASSVRELLSALHCITQMAKITGSGITVELVDEALDGFFGRYNRHVGLDDILGVLVERYDVGRSDILSVRRSQHLVHARHMGMYLARELTNFSYSEIGKAFGGRHHTTVKSACGKVAELRRAGPSVEAEYLSLVKQIRG